MAKAINSFAKENEIIFNHANLVKKIAYHLIAKLPSSIQLEDLVQAGMIGLIEAQKNFNSNKGASFTTYAGIRIRGAMLDEIRKSDWAPRSVHRNSRRVTEAIREIKNSTNRDASDIDVAKHLNISIDEYHKILIDSTNSKILAFAEVGMEDEIIISNFENEPLDGLQKQDFREKLSTSIADLPEKERLVLALYYDEELNLREIGEVLDVSESRISQIHSQAMLRLQAKMQDWK